MNQPGFGSMPGHEGERAGLDAGPCRARPRLPVPGSPGTPGRAASTLQSKPAASAPRCASSTVGVAGIGHDHEAIVGRAG